MLTIFAKSFIGWVLNTPLQTQNVLVNIMFSDIASVKTRYLRVVPTERAKHAQTYNKVQAYKKV